MAGITMKALVDIRATCTLMAETIFEQMCNAAKKMPLLRSTGTVCGFGGRTLLVVGETELMID